MKKVIFTLLLTVLVFCLVGCYWSQADWDRFGQDVREANDTARQKECEDREYLLRQMTPPPAPRPYSHEEEYYRRKNLKEGLKRYRP